MMHFCRSMSVRVCSTFVFLLLGLSAQQVALGHPVDVQYVNTPDQCLNIINRDLEEEIGTLPMFPADELMSVNVNAATDGDCGIAVGGGNDYEVELTNDSGRNFTYVFVVADTGTTFSNWDGNIAGSRAMLAKTVWLDGDKITFRLMDVIPNVVPTFGSLGVNSGGAGSNFSIVANLCLLQPDCAVPIPTTSAWGLGVMGLLLLGAGTWAFRAKRGVA